MFYILLLLPFNVMIYESVYDGDTEAVDTIAKNMVDTFTWAEN